MISKIAVNAGGVVYEPTAESANAETDSAREFWLLCRAGSHCFALPMPHVIEIMRMLPIKSLVGAPPQVRGLCIIRGTPVPVIDAGLLFDEQGSSCERLVTVRTGERTIAFATGAVLAVEKIRGQALEELPPLLNNIGSLEAITALDEELVFLLRIARIIPDDFRVDHFAAGVEA
ncbi:MAG: chemotaxis protein CheW [Xanthobacteraceae bacterium]